MRLSTSATFVSLAMLVAGATARADVRVVNAAGGGATYTTIQAAINAANDGDVILVRPGVYSSFVVTNRSLDLVADAPVSVQGTAQVQGLIAARAVTLLGFQFTSSDFTPPLRVGNNTGSVRVQDCTATPPATVTLTGGCAGVEIFNSMDVALVRVVTGGSRGPNSGDGRAAITSTSSRVALFDVVARGGSGGNDFPDFPGDPYIYGGYGGSGVVATGNGFTFAAGSLLYGGSGGIGYGGGANPGVGGLAIEYTPALGHLLGNWLRNGSPQRTWIPIVNDLPGPARHVSGVPALREGQVLQLTFGGVPGEEVLLHVGDRTQFQYVAAQSGVRLVRTKLPGQPPNPVMQVGTIAANGFVTLSATIEELGPGVQSRRMLIQPSFRDSSGIEVLGPPETIVLLDSAY